MSNVCLVWKKVQQMALFFIQKYLEMKMRRYCWRMIKNRKETFFWIAINVLEFFGLYISFNAVIRHFQVIQCFCAKFLWKIFLMINNWLTARIVCSFFGTQDWLRYRHIRLHKLITIPAPICKMRHGSRCQNTGEKNHSK